MNIWRGFVAVSMLSVAFLVSGCAGLGSMTGGGASPITGVVPGEQEVGLYNIMEDTAWGGNIRITGDVYVKEGATLTIKPGTVIRFDSIEPRLEEDGGRNWLGLDTPYFPGAEIIVRGRIIAVGTPSEPIVFTSSDPDAKPGVWGAINLLGSNGNIIEHCKVSYAYNGIHNHASTAVVLNSEFSRNGTALSFKKEDFDHPCWMFIEHNRIADNLSGISLRYSIVNIAFNDIVDNEFFGLFVKEGTDSRIAYNNILRNGKGVYLYKAPPTKLTDNNIHDNVDYNVAMAEMNPNDVDATGNWWGATGASAIAMSMFDKDADPELGKVNFEPFATGPVKGAGR